MVINFIACYKDWFKIVCDFLLAFKIVLNIRNCQIKAAQDQIDLRSRTYSQQNHLSLELARTQLIAYNRLIILQNTTQMAQFES